MQNNLKIEIKQGSLFHRLVSLKDDSGESIDLTGCEIKGHIKYTFNSTKLAEFEFLIKDQNLSKGEFDWKLASDALDGINLSSPVSALYDLELTSSGGIKTELFRGVVSIYPRVTK